MTLSGEYLTPGSKISFDSLESGKIIRLGIAWRGESSCDIDHSLNLLNKGKSVYYNSPIYKENKEIIISSSGDITSCDNDLFSTELIDIDLDLAIKYNLGNMLSSIIQYSGKTLNNYEVFWFMNIIERKDRIIEDSCRVFRFFRFISEKGYKPDKKSLKACRENFEFATKNTNSQRILKELERIVKI